MIVTITVKEVNPKFDREFAEREHGGKESEDNILYTWEDEFRVNGDVTDFHVRNNTVHTMEVMKGDEKVTYEIPAVTLIDSVTAAQTITCVFSRSLIKDTKKVVNKSGDIHFYVFLKGGKKIVNPMTGIYIDVKDFPKDLPLPEDEEMSGDEEE